MYRDRKVIYSGLKRSDSEERIFTIEMDDGDESGLLSPCTSYSKFQNVKVHNNLTRDKRSLLKLKILHTSPLPNNTLTGSEEKDDRCIKTLNSKIQQSDPQMNRPPAILKPMKNTNNIVTSNLDDEKAIEEDYKTLERVVKNLQNLSTSLNITNEHVKTLPKLRIDEAIGTESSEDKDESVKLIGNKAVAWNDSPPTPRSPQSPTTPVGFRYNISSKSRYFKRGMSFPQRAVLKNGECNVLHTSISNSKVRYLHDIFTTLVDAQWRWTLLVFAMGFMLSWLFYAILWWLIAYAHGDFDHIGDENWTPCVEALHGFATCFLFSVETQHTIGYGGRSTNDECPEAIFVMCMQSITGVMISAFMAGIFFAKTARPRQRSQTLLFSRRAVICLRDGQLCLMFRVGDMRKSHIIGPNVKAHMFRTRTTKEGEVLPQYQCQLSLAVDGCQDDIFFIWPLTLVHKIDSDSPFYNLSAHELIHETFEVVAILDGTVESTGQTTQARTSYLPNEIKWGHRFEPLITYNDDRQGYQVDYKKFNNTLKVATPLCSAKELDNIYSVHSELNEYNGIVAE